MSKFVTVPDAQLASTAVSLPGLGISDVRPKADPLHRMVGWLRARLQYGSVLRELERLDDRTLADIGMERPHLTRIAWRLSRPSQ